MRFHLKSQNNDLRRGGEGMGGPCRGGRLGRLERGGGCRCRSQIECDPEPGLPARGLPVGPTDPVGGIVAIKRLPLCDCLISLLFLDFLGRCVVAFFPRLVVFLDLSMVCLHCFDENQVFGPAQRRTWGRLDQWNVQWSVESSISRRNRSH